MGSQSHRSDPRILNRRTLERDHRYLAALLQPGLTVLDIGCGTGSITAGIACAVGPSGRVLGMDRDEKLLQIAREQYGTLPNLAFDRGDILQVEAAGQFDVVTAARTLQWVGDLETAVARMQRAAKPSGLVVVLDYNHAANRWEPEPPAEFLRFYHAFLAWRESNGWDNRIAGHLPALFTAAGLEDVTSHLSDEAVRRNEPDFAVAASLWAGVIDSLGGRISASGFLGDLRVSEVSRIYRDWIDRDLQYQFLSMSTVAGRVQNRA